VRGFDEMVEDMLAGVDGSYESDGQVFEGGLGVEKMRRKKRKKEKKTREGAGDNEVTSQHWETVEIKNGC
jgi:hypothetical protein